MAITQINPFADPKDAEPVIRYEEVRHQIESWPSVERARLAQYIISTLVPGEATKPKRRNSVAEIFGRMAVDGVPAPGSY
jgi:hypothetical protein